MARIDVEGNIQQRKRIRSSEAARQPGHWLHDLGPGVALAALIGLTAWVLQLIEVQLIGHAVIEALVIAILLGMLWRNLWGLSQRFQAGVKFTGKQVLEFAIVLLGASIDFPALLQAGPVLLGSIIGVVAVGMLISILIGHAIGLNPRLAILVAVGNSICGNSAIAAVAPAIRAEPKDVASAVGLTAVLGVILVLSLPMLIPLLGFTAYQYGVLAGMTVYAVPQVLAATFPVSALSGEVGTLVKLVRVLLLGPVVLIFTLLYRSSSAQSDSRPAISRFVPWFIVGFLLLGVLHSIGLLPRPLAIPLRESSRWLTTIAMAALGLGVDISSMRSVGPSVAGAVAASLVVLIVLASGLILALGIG